MCLSAQRGTGLPTLRDNRDGPGPLRRFEFYVPHSDTEQLSAGHDAGAQQRGAGHDAQRRGSGLKLAAFHRDCGPVSCRAE